MRFEELPPRVRHTYYYDLRAAVLIGVFGGLLLPFVSVVGRKIGATDLQIALLAAAPYLANLVALFWTEDLFGQGRVWYVVWPCVVGRGLLLAMFWVYSPFWYTALIFVYMFITAIPFPSYASIMKTNYPDDLRGTLMSRVRARTALFWIASSALAGVVLERSTQNYRYVFPAAAVFGVLAALQFRAVRVEREERKRGSLSGIKGLAAPFRDRPFLRFLAVYSFFETGLLFALPVFPLVLVDEARITNFATGIYGSVFSGMWLAGFFFWGYFMDRHSLGKTLALIFTLACVIPLLYLLTRDISMLGAAQGVSGFVFAAVELVNYIVTTRMAASSEVPHYMAANVALGGLRGAIAPFAGTAVYAAWGSPTVFAIALALVSMSVVLSVVLLRKGLYRQPL